MVRPLPETAWQFLHRLNMELPHDPAMPLLGACTREPKTGAQTFHSQQPKGGTAHKSISCPW